MEHRSIKVWLASFQSACSQQNGDAIAAMFSDDGLWRDYLAFDTALQTIEGRERIAKFASQHCNNVGLTALNVEDNASADEGSFSFNNRLGKGRGYIRLKDGLCTTLFTSLLDLSHVEKKDSARAEAADPFVLIVGGGQSGLALGAQLSHLNISYLIVDKYPNVGDQWRSRYDSLVLHDPVWYDHLPFLKYPESWPVFTPKEKMGDWLEHYANTLDLNVSTSTTLINARFDSDRHRWTARMESGGIESNVYATHLVMALGLSGFPHRPAFKGQETFSGRQLHSSEFKVKEHMTGKNVVVVGANNSAHDIAADLVDVDAKPILLQRSSTLVVKQSVYCNKLLGKLYSKEAVERGIDVDEADFQFSTVPMRLLEERHRELWKEIQNDDKEFYKQLGDAGFNLDFAEDGAGLGLKYRRTASGYYIDVGASQMVIDGRIGIRSGVNIDRLTKNHIVLDSGESIAADIIVYATGYGNMVDWVSALINSETAERIGPCWGYGSGTKGDPGPWLGELRNMWMPTAQKGLWFMGGNLAQVRYFSHVLALQLQARILDVV